MILFSPSSFYKHIFQPVQPAQLFMVWADDSTIALAPIQQNTQCCEKKKHFWYSWNFESSIFFRVFLHAVCWEMKLAVSQALALPSCRGSLPMQFIPEESNLEGILVKYWFLTNSTEILLIIFSFNHQFLSLKIQFSCSYFLQGFALQRLLPYSKMFKSR